MKKNSLFTKIGYGVGDMYAGGAFLLVGLLFLNFLTDVAGLSPALAGIVFFVGKIWDAISDPLMGFISDRTKSKHGRRRIYFLIGIIPIFFTFAMLWYTVKSENQTVLFIYYMFSYILFNTVFTLVMVPYNALLPNMIKDYKLRTSFNTVRLTCSAVSAILSGVFPMIIVNSFESTNTGYMMMAFAFGLLYSLPWILVFRKTWELPVVKTEEKARFGDLFKEFFLSFRNKSFRIHSGFFVSGQTAVDFLTTLFIYYLTYVLGRKGEFSAVLGVLLVVQLISMSIHGKISRTYGKTVPLRIGLGVWLVGLVITLLITKDSPSYLIYVVAAMSGVGSSASTFVPWSILPEISDIDEMITGRRREGIYAGMSTLIRKVAQAVSVFIIGVVLEQIGYIANIEQSASTVLGIRLLFFIGPVLFMIIAFITSSRYKMTEKRHDVLMNEIASRKNGAEPSQDAEVIEICEDLTGVKYSRLAKFK